jgi:hypothetical protein
MADDPRTMTTLAYTRASKRASTRLQNLFHHIWPDMIGVWLVGADRADSERAVWIGGRSVGNPGLTFFATCGLRTGVDGREVEMLGLFVSAALAMEVSVFTDDRVPGYNSNGDTGVGDAAVNLQQARGQNATSTNVIYATGTDARIVSLPARFQLAANALLDLSPLVLGAIIPENRTLCVQCGTVNVAADALKVSFAWRELGPG